MLEKLAEVLLSQTAVGVYGIITLTLFVFLIRAIINHDKKASDIYHRRGSHDVGTGI